MKVGILTSSRADYSIYFPLLKALQKDAFFELHILAFGTHLSHTHGYTLQAILEDGFLVAAQYETAPLNDSPEEISYAVAKTISVFTSHWKNNDYDVVFCLGDRYEMFAACASSIPFGIKLAHIHGGETTLGAIDNIYRHSITHMCKLHFTSTELYKNRVLELLDVKENVYHTGALGLDTFKNLKLLSIDDFNKKYNFDFSKKTILITFHPETVNYKMNSFYMDELIAALKQLPNFQFLITMPNADTNGTIIRSKWNQFSADKPTQAFAFENLGTLGYISAMKHCSFVLGNSSSGCIEAAFFPKWVINLGDRQKGRMLTSNRVNCELKSESILEAIAAIQDKKLDLATTLFGDGNAAEKICSILKKL